MGQLIEGWYCSTCGRAPEAPYRKYNADGVVIEGCVSAAHHGHGDAWHYRPAAVAMRAQHSSPDLTWSEVAA